MLIPQVNNELISSIPDYQFHKKINLPATTILNGNVRTVWCSYLCPNGPHISVQNGKYYVT